jgi:F0F1-type ATP synthase delta subunit
MKITPKHYAIAWYEALTETSADQWPAISLSILKLIQRADHVGWLPQIIKQFEEYDDAKRGVTRIAVTSAHDFDVETIKNYITTIMPQISPEINKVLNKNVIGGLVVETKDNRWNLSIKGQLNALTQTLKR